MKKVRKKDLHRVLWQGSGEKLWEAGPIKRPRGDEVCSVTFDFLWTDQDDARRIGSCDHEQKLTLYGDKPELARLAPLLETFLNANRLPSEMPKAAAEAAKAA